MFVMKNLSIHSFCIILCMAAFGSCNNLSQQEYNRTTDIEEKVDSLLAIMTLDEKIGQMSQVRHFADIANEDIATKFIGSVIHTSGPTPGEDATGWQSRFIFLQKKALSTRLGIPLLFGVDAVHGQNTFEGATIFPHNIGMGATHKQDWLKKPLLLLRPRCRLLDLTGHFLHVLQFLTMKNGEECTKHSLRVLN